MLDKRTAPEKGRNNSGRGRNRQLYWHAKRNSYKQTKSTGTKWGKIDDFIYFMPAVHIRPGEGARVHSVHSRLTDIWILVSSTLVHNQTILACKYHLHQLLILLKFFLRKWPLNVVISIFFLTLLLSYLVVRLIEPMNRWFFFILVVGIHWVSHNGFILV